MISFILATAPLLAVPPQAPKSKDVFSERVARLGRERNEFGDPDDIPNNQDFEIWKCRQTMMGMDTQAYFPVGVSSRRYYLNEVDAVYLALETKRGGIIRMEWVVKLRFLSKKELSKPINARSGTLAIMLRRSGLAPTGTIPKAARHALAARKGFACYVFNPAPPVQSMTYGYVEAKGRRTLRRSDSADFGDNPRPTYLPDIGRPYPVTAMEQEDMRHLQQRRRRQ